MTAAPTKNKRTALRHLIEERGLKYNFVAAKLNVSPSILTRLLNAERNLTASDLVTLQELLGVEAKAFFDGGELLIATETPTASANAEVGNPL